MIDILEQFYLVDACDQLSWIVRNNELRFFITVNDTFIDGADVEEVNMQDVPLLKQCVKDCYGYEEYLSILFASRKRDKSPLTKKLYKMPFEMVKKFGAYAENEA